ncbi:MAG: hypothetical protein R8M38_04780 [Mariprofundaceae bacterium]
MFDDIDIKYDDRCVYRVMALGYGFRIEPSQLIEMHGFSSILYVFLALESAF